MIDLLKRIEAMEYAAREVFLSSGGIPTDFCIWLAGDSRESHGDLSELLDGSLPPVIALASAGIQFAAVVSGHDESCNVEAIALLSNGLVCDNGKDPMKDGQQVVSIMALDLSEDAARPNALCVTYDVIAHGGDLDLANRSVMRLGNVDIREAPIFDAFMRGVKFYFELTK